MSLDFLLSYWCYCVLVKTQSVAVFLQCQTPQTRLGRPELYIGLELDGSFCVTWHIPNFSHIESKGRKFF